MMQEIPHNGGNLSSWRKSLMMEEMFYDGGISYDRVDLYIDADDDGVDLCIDAMHR